MVKEIQADFKKRSASKKPAVQEFLDMKREDSDLEEIRIKSVEEIPDGL